MAEALKCGVCWHGFDTDTRAPLLLPCGHTFCAVCAPQLRTCAMCRQQLPPQEPAPFPRNFQLLAVIDVMGGPAASSGAPAGASPNVVNSSAARARAGAGAAAGAAAAPPVQQGALPSEAAGAQLGALRQQMEQHIRATEEVIGENFALRAELVSLSWCMLWGDS